MSTPSTATQVVFIPALLCDEQVYREVIAVLDDAIEPRVLLSPKPWLENTSRPPHDGRMAFVRSPDGISVALLQAGHALAPAEPWTPMPNEGRW